MTARYPDLPPGKKPQIFVWGSICHESRLRDQINISRPPERRRNDN
jgi:hypothetical protein